MQCTIVSLVPFELKEFKPGLFPAQYVIPAAKADDFEILVVDDAIHYVYVDMDRGNIKLKASANEIAKAVVDDFVRGCLAVDEDAIPGLFWIEGAKDKKRITIEHVMELGAARRRQINWFKRLTEMADDDWERTRQHKAISDLQRYAAKYLKLQRPWLIDLTANMASSAVCPSCQMTIHPEVVVCPHCRLILRPEQYKKLSFAVQ